MEEFMLSSINCVQQGMWKKENKTKIRFPVAAVQNCSELPVTYCEYTKALCLF